MTRDELLADVGVMVAAVRDLPMSDRSAIVSYLLGALQGTLDTAAPRDVPAIRRTVDLLRRAIDYIAKNPVPCPACGQTRTPA